MRIKEIRYGRTITTAPYETSRFELVADVEEHDWVAAFDVLRTCADELEAEERDRRVRAMTKRTLKAAHEDPDFTPWDDK